MDEVHKQKYFEDYLSNLSDSSKQNYLYYYNKFGGLSELNSDNVTSFIKEHHNSVARAFIKNLLEYCKTYSSEIKQNYGESFFDGLNSVYLPKIISKKNLSPVEKTITVPELDIVLFNLPKEYRAITKVTYYTGLRSREIRNIVAGDFNFDIWKQFPDGSGRLIVRAEIAKRNKARPVFVIPEMMKEIFDYVERNDLEKEDLLFPHLNSENEARKWRHHLRKVSLLKLGRGVSPHCLRHSFATNLIKKGFSIDKVSLLLGHADLSTTQLYTHLSIQDIQEEYERLINQP